jgi:hypothetical protein
VARDWSTDGAELNDLGHKIDSADVPDMREDRTAVYRRFRRTIRQAGATDFDQVEWRYNDHKNLVPVALLELTRVDGNMPVPAGYLNAILARYMERDWQGALAVAGAGYLGVRAWIVAFRYDLTEFWVYNLSDRRGWFHGDVAWYERWISALDYRSRSDTHDPDTGASVKSGSPKAGGV